MTADPDNLRFFVDESLMGIGKSLAAARTDVVHTGHRLIPEIPVGTLDTVWIPAIAGRELVVIARDRHIRTRPAELLLLHEHGLRVFYVAGKKDLSNWDYLTRLVRRWDDMEHEIDARGPGPWFVEIWEFNVKTVPLRPGSARG
jgi:hypothetical protein